MSDDKPADKLWGGRFNEPTDAFVEDFTASVGFDRRLYRQDIAGSIAHATMLARVGVLSAEDAASIVSGLEAIRYDGEELVIGEAGVVTFRLGDREHAVAAGDSLHFDASIPHSWRNDGPAVARFTITGNRSREFRALLHERVARAADRPAASGT